MTFASHQNPGSDGPQSSGWDFHAWGEGLSVEQLTLQQDLSCLVDGELNEAAAARAMVLLEESRECQSYLADIRRFARLHRDLSDPQRLEARVAMLGSGEIARAAENIDLAHRLATIFYQLGKAYTLSALDPDGFRERVFESAVPVDATKTRGRGFVDGVMSSGRADELAPDAGSPGTGSPGTGFGGSSGFDTGSWGGRDAWTEARHLLNGRLERIADPLDKGRRLLEQATEIDPSHEEARIYLAYILGLEGKSLRAAALYRDVFDTAMSLANRGHAAMQLGRMHFREGDHREAMVLWRWMTVSGLASDDPRFSLVHFNIGVAHAVAGKDDRALDSFRALMDQHLESGGAASELAALFVDNDDARKIFEDRPGFIDRLAERIPELIADAI